MKLITESYSFVYKWINTTTKEYYIGVHKGNINDGYTGSGKIFKAKYKKSPDLWERLIISKFDSYDNALYLESILVTEETLKDDKCINLKPGGSGGGGPQTNETKNKIGKASKARWALPEYRKKLVTAYKDIWTDDHIRMRKENNTIFTETNQPNQQSRKNGVEKRKAGVGYTHRIGYKFSDKSKKIMSEIAKRRPHVECPRCEVVGPKPQMSRWHFDNCKDI